MISLNTLIGTEVFVMDNNEIIETKIINFEQAYYMNDCREHEIIYCSMSNGKRYYPNQVFSSINDIISYLRDNVKFLKK